MTSPIEFDVRWPDGPPMRMTEDEFREYCARLLKDSRGSRR